MRIRLLLLGLVATIFLLAPAEAEAQDCGDWRDPVLCEVDFQLMDESRRWNDFYPDRDLEIRTDSEIEIELRGRDQFRRSFPQDRIVLGFDDRDCSRYLRADDLGEGRIRIQTFRDDGRCRLELFAPGNLNFAWTVDVEVGRSSGGTSAISRRYTRSEAEMIARDLYLAILGRAGDSGGIAGAVGEIERGNLEAQVDAMLDSAEFRSSIASAGPRDILSRFYDGLFGRSVDRDGELTFLPVVERRQYRQVILDLIRSREYEDRLR
jgi:hypothetical protein